MDFIDYIDGIQAIKAIYGSNITTFHNNQILKMEFGFGNGNYIDINFHINKYPINLKFINKYPIEKNFYKINFVIGGILNMTYRDIFLNENADFHLNREGEVLSFIFKNSGELVVNCKRVTCRNIIPYSIKPFYKRIKKFNRINSLQNILNISSNNDYLSFEIEILYIEILIEFSELLIVLNVEGRILHLLLEDYVFDSFFENINNNQGELTIYSLSKPDRKLIFISKNGLNSFIIKYKEMFYDFNIDYHYNRRIYNIYN